VADKISLMLSLRSAALGLSAWLAFAAPVLANSTVEQFLHYPYRDALVSARQADRIAWVRNLDGVRNLWVAQGPDFRPHQATSYTQDDGLEITQPTFSPDGKSLVYVRGGYHDANWQEPLAPNPTSSPEQQRVVIWRVPLKGGTPVPVVEGDAPAISADGQLAYIKDGQVWTTSFDGKAKPERLFFDRGKIRDLQWSPEGHALAFVSNRGDHSFIGIFVSRDKPLLYLAPTTCLDLSPRWSPDGKRIAFVRRPGDGGEPEPRLKQVSHPWSIWVGDATTGEGRLVWKSPNTFDGSYPTTVGQANLHWAAGNRLVFLADLDNWPHLYSISADGGRPLLLTPGTFMVEHVAESRDGKYMIYDANTGATAGDFDRRHLFRVAVEGGAPITISSGTSLDWTPVIAGDDRIAFLSAGAQRPPVVAIANMNGEDRRDLDDGSLPAEFPVNQLVTPKPVTFKAADGTLVHGQLFERSGGGKKPGLIFVHGGPARQMLLGWHYMDTYSIMYAMNQYFTNHGIVVLSVNYRLSLGYGRAFHQPAHAGASGASEYQDVVAGARYLQGLPGVDAQRIGIWGGSYGGYLTALALARNSDIFKVGVDHAGVHDWSAFLGQFNKAPSRYEKGDRDEAMKVAFESSPDAAIKTWTSPVLLIQGDDDRNVLFAQTVDLARRLDAAHVPYEELVLPNEIHGFLRYGSWLRADKAIGEYLMRHFTIKSE
jgi:dipeptidyl aminopeptidase/acylaminoacyl peptidase